MDTRQAILDALCRQPLVSGDALAATLGLSRSAVWKHIRQLRQRGLDIEAVPGRGYRLRDDVLNAAAIRAGLPADARIGRAIEIAPRLASTNSALLARVDELDEGFVLLAEEQTHGRGRLGRRWHSEPGCALTFSVLLKPRCAPEQASSLPLVVACALHQALAELVPALRLKWPNDLLVDGAKLGGILMEMRAEPGCVHGIVVGIGLNVRPPHQGWPAGLRQPAVALAQAGVHEPRRNAIAAACLQALDASYALWREQGFRPFRDYWWRFHAGANRRVRVHDGRGYIEGIARGIDAHGALLLQQGERSLRILAGDLEHLG